MVYRAIGLMSGSSLDGLDIAFAEFREQAGKWSFEILQANCYPYNDQWMSRLKNAIALPALDYQLLHTEYGHYIGREVNKFIDEYKLHYQVALIASHGHTTFHIPAQKMTGQLGDGAAIAAETQLPVVTDLRAMDIAFGGQGAPIVPIGEKLLLGNYNFFLNLGGIANITVKLHPNPPHPSTLPGAQRSGERASETPDNIKPVQAASSKSPSSFGEEGLRDEVFIAFDVCPANRVLNILANELGKEYDDGGQITETGKIDNILLENLNALDYYKQPFPKSLANDFGTDIIYPLIRNKGIDIQDALRTYTEHIAVQISNAITRLNNYKLKTINHEQHPADKLLVTGGGAFNRFLIQRIKEALLDLNIEVIVPDVNLINYKEALIMAFIGVLRWRQEYNVLSSVTGAARDSIGGALWTGQEA